MAKRRALTARALADLDLWQDDAWPKDDIMAEPTQSAPLVPISERIAADLPEPHPK